MSKKPKMPIDVKKLLDSVANVGQQRDLPVHVDLVFDPTASERLVDCVIDAFSSAAPQAFVETTVLGMHVPELPLPADLCVIVGGDSLLLGDVASAARAKGIPAVVAIERGQTYFAGDMGSAQALADLTLKENTVPTAAGTSLAPTVGKGIPVEDIVDLDLSAQARRPLEELGTWIVTHAPAKRISLAADFEFLRHPLAVELVAHTAVQNGAVGLVFFVPGADMPLITLNQAKMAIQIAAVYGQELDWSRAKEVVAIVAGGFGFRGIARKLSSLVPVLGWAIKPSVAASGTLAMGYAAITYYEGGTPADDMPEALESIFVKLGDAADKGASALEQLMDGFLAHRPRKG